MEDLFKKFINAGVGYLAQGNKKVQSTIEALVKDSKLSEQEGKKIVDDLLKSSETKRTELEQQFKGLAERMKDSVGLKAKAKSPAAAKKAPAKKAGAPKAASSATSKVASATKKAADQVSAAAGTAQKSAAAKAGAPKAAAKPRAAKKTAAPAADAPEA
ncbi:MAG: phasin family protein [Janthinobacterium lividum]